MPPNKRQEKQTKSIEPEPALDPITLEGLREAIGDLTQIAQTVLQELPARRANLRLAFDAENDAQVDKLAHLIAGSLSNLGASKLTRLAYAMEIMDKNDNRDAARETLEQLERESERVIAALTMLLTTEHPGSHHTDPSQ